MASSIAYATFKEVVMSALEVRNTHERYYITKGSGQYGRQQQRSRTGPPRFAVAA